MYQSGYRLVRKGFMEFDHVTNWNLYPDRYIKMIPYFLIRCLSPPPSS
jgi:hypothetical protein